ncbi:MAG: hypothetical protein PHS77_04970 [Gallionellaceae bacterium]|nr:hypothetical protein [Gallionellaceae bacterium]
MKQSYAVEILFGVSAVLFAYAVPGMGGKGLWGGDGGMLIVAFVAASYLAHLRRDSFRRGKWQAALAGVAISLATMGLSLLPGFMYRGYLEHGVVGIFQGAAMTGFALIAGTITLGVFLVPVGAILGLFARDFLVEDESADGGI